MTRMLQFTLAASFVVAGIAGDASAGRARLGATNTTFFLHATDSGCQSGFELSVADGPDAANCGFIDAGVAQEATKVALNRYTTARTWAAQDGLPLRLDATRSISTDITLKSFEVVPPGSLGAGQAVLDLTFTAFSDGKQVTVGQGQETYVVTPGTNEYRIRFDIDVADELQGKTITSLDLTTVVRGAAILHGAFSVDDPSSTITIPTFVRRTSR